MCNVCITLTSINRILGNQRLCLYFKIEFLSIFKKKYSSIDIILTEQTKENNNNEE